MRHTSSFLAFACTLALALALVVVPSAVAGWHGIGTSEPDTPFDATGARMFGSPDTNPNGMRVYFDAFATQGGPEPFSPLNGANVNPNVGALGSRIQPAGLVQFSALLGTWKDCNADGYVGLAEGGVQEYRAELLLGQTTICPPGGAFNDGAWVDEFLFIGAVDPCQFQSNDYRAQHCNGIPGVDQTSAYLQNPRVFSSNDTYVWGDWGAPGEAAKPACPLPPFARGTTAGPGTLLAAADCQDAREATALLDALPADSSGARATRFPVNLFGDPESRKSGLAQQNSSDASFTAWDCSSRLVTVTDPTNGLLSIDKTQDDPSGGSFTGNQPIPVVGQQHVFPLRVRTVQDDGTMASVANPAPSVNDPTGSWWDGAAGALDGAAPAGDCNASTRGPVGDAYPGALVESDRAIVTPYKTSNDIVMTFSRGYRGESHLDPYLGTRDLPDDGGVVYTRNLYGGPLWMASAPTLADPDVIDRSELSVAGARWLTFYARLNASDITSHLWTLPPGATATGAYGAEACGSRTTGQLNGWECDPQKWYRAADGSSTMPHYAEGGALGQLPGAPYHMRDVDCYDGQLARGVPVYAGGAALGVSPTCGS